MWPTRHAYSTTRRHCLLMLHTDGDILRLQSANRQFKYTPAKQLLQGLVCLLLLHKPTSAEQEWYEYDDSIINGSVSCYFMEMDRQQGRLCTATQILFDRSEQELGQIHDMLDGSTLLQVQVPAPARDSVPHMDVANADTPFIKLASFFGEYHLTPAPPSNIQTNCEANGLLMFKGQPVVFMVHDHAEMGHFLTVQLAPLVVALKTVGWDKQPFQLIVIDRQSTHPPIRSEKDIFIPILDKLSGSETLSLAHMPEMFCADRALVGVGTNAMLLAHDGTKFYEFQTNEEVDHNRAAFTDMRSWVLQSFGIMESSPEGNKARPSMLAITIIDRGPAPVARRIINQDMLAAAAAKVGRVQVVRLQDISFEEQLQLMLSTDVMIAAHGSAVSMMVFLPPQAVVVEVKAYKHGLTQDFTHGHCNLARATDTSLLVWHNRQLEHTRRWEGAGVGDPFYKNQHTYIPDADIDLILDSALQTWHTPVSVRNFNDVWFLNSAETLS